VRRKPVLYQQQPVSLPTLQFRTIQVSWRSTIPRTTRPLWRSVTRVLGGEREIVVYLGIGPPPPQATPTLIRTSLPRNRDEEGNVASKVFKLLLKGMKLRQLRWDTTIRNLVRMTNIAVPVLSTSKTSLKQWKSTTALKAQISRQDLCRIFQSSSPMKKIPRRQITVTQGLLLLMT
jgi:hypothetical protein